MKFYQKSIITASIIIFQLSCNTQSNKEFQKDMVATDSIYTSSSSAAVENNKDTSRKFIRTADLKFKVKDVVRSTYDIEDITNQHGGFVSYTDLTSVTDDVVTTPVSADSSIETKYYTVINNITLRVPNTKLDTVLKDIARNIDYLDARVIKAEDVALQILSNDLTQKRNAKAEVRLTNAIDTKAKKLAETYDAEEVLADKQEQTDDAKISTLSLRDKVKFSTVSLALYQREGVKKETIANKKVITAYEPGVGSQLMDSLKYGWEMLEAVIVFLAKLWWVILIGVGAYLISKRSLGKEKG
ncbi:MAG: DUF4349 domain-containing protein [Bacteroidota bacterium]